MPGLVGLAPMPGLDDRLRLFPGGKEFDGLPEEVAHDAKEDHVVSGRYEPELRLR